MNWQCSWNRVVQEGQDDCIHSGCTHRTLAAAAAAAVEPGDTTGDMHLAVLAGEGTEKSESKVCKSIAHQAVAGMVADMDIAGHCSPVVEKTERMSGSTTTVVVAVSVPGGGLH